jgi:clan AA aspartic protease (TIGR02281 family)
MGRLVIRYVAVALVAGLLSAGVGKALAQNLSGVSVGDDASKAFQLLGKIPARSERSGPVAYYKWRLDDDNSLSITVRMSDNKIVFMASDWGHKSDITDFPGFIFGRTTRAELFKKLGSNGIVFKHRDPIWITDKRDLVSSDSYQTTDNPPLIATFMTLATRDQARQLYAKGKPYFSAHLWDTEVLVSIMVGEPEYVRSIWGDIDYPLPKGYHNVAVSSLQPGVRAKGNPVIGGVKMIERDGNLWAPVQINGKLQLDFVVDSGASEVQIPEDVFHTLVRTGTISNADFLGKNIYTLADGSKVPSDRYMLRRLEVGTYVVENVTASIGPANSDPLLGQSFLSKFRSWTLDNKNDVLILTQ